MIIKNVTISFGLIFFIVQLLLTGCSQKYDETWYQSPTWTPEGLIYFQKSITHYDKQPMGTITLGTDYEYWTMTDEGTQETKLPYNKYPYYSPQGTYVAFISGNNISIVRRSDNQEIYNFSPTTESISEIDWGPNENKLAYLTAKGCINIIIIDGSNNNRVFHAAEKIIWGFGERIIFQDTSISPSKISMINADSTGYSQIVNGIYPQNKDNNIIIFNAYGTSEICSINITGTSEVKLFSEFSGYQPKYSAVKNMLVYGQLWESGIWVININGTGLKKLK